ncbi:Tryptophan--tRNA ligase, mitochondrial [Taxawa tesnikishii (nom. ined.)]|nr:Tryptophan--tRNA ligase, mitochondrial [Dothideales sp. JES 119]
MSPAKRVMALDRPTLKMSKSHPNPKSRIILTDSREVLGKKLRSALTDSIEGVSYDPAARPGVSNLLDIAYHLDASGAGSPQDLARDWQDLSMRALKEKVTEAVDAHLAPIRERYLQIMSGGTRELEEAAELGAQKASLSAAVTMKSVRNAMGL